MQKSQRAIGLVIVGATFTGTEVADRLQAATIAIVSKTPVELLWQAVPAFPTRSEISNRDFAARQALRPPRLAGHGPDEAGHTGHSRPDAS